MTRPPWAGARHVLSGDVGGVGDAGVFGVLLVVALAVRVPFLFRAVIDWDESTFILIGQSLLDGDLPYTRLWALKPPLAFAFYSVVIAVFGKSLIAIRLAGTLCVVVVAFLLHLAASRLWGRRVGLMAGTLCVVTMSLLGSGQATMTEHVALVPLTAAFCLLVRYEATAGTFFAAGLLLGVASLVRLNMAYAAVAAGLYVLIAAVGRSPARTAGYAAGYAGGGTLAVATTWLPYALSGQHALWWTSVVVAPLRYVDARSSVLVNLATQSRQALGFSETGRGVSFDGSCFTAFVWLAAVGGAAVLIKQWRAGETSGRGVVLVALFTLGVGFGIVNTGRPYPHHLIQLAPFAAALSALFLNQCSPRLRVPALVLVGALALVSLRSEAGESLSVLSRVLAHETVPYGPAYEIAEYLKRENPGGRPVFLVTDQLAYWLSDSRPPTKLSAHPANLNEPWLIETLTGKPEPADEGLREVFRQHPEFVVTREPVGVLRRDLTQVLEGILNDQYVPAARIGDRTIYRIKSGSAPPSARQ